jgi:MoxR-like ATPase
LFSAYNEIMQTLINQVINQISGIILGKTPQIRMALTCLLARGHLLIEDVPGMGKTILSHALAVTLGLQFRRIQFTSDMLPADILGVSVYDKTSASFKFHPGPIFSHLVLADEINRATPKTQSALLEAMEEHQATVEGETRPLPSPFFVIATQNPMDQIGTFPLPESQLDRFLMCIHLGFPEKDAERMLLKGDDRRDMIAGLSSCLTADQLRELQEGVKHIHVSDALFDYLQAILAHTRESRRFRMGLSPRAGLALLHSAQAWALIEGRDHVVPEDVQAVLAAVVNHRLQPVAESAQISDEDLAAELLRLVPIP